MKKQKFIEETNKFLFKEITKNTNLICGLSKASTAIANLFAVLPFKAEFRRVNSLPNNYKNNSCLENLVHAYCKHDDSSTVYIAFFYEEKNNKEENERQFAKFYTKIKRNPEFFAYLYLREAFKLIQLVNTKTNYLAMSKILEKTNVSREDYYKIIQIASEYFINNVINELFQNSIIEESFKKIMKNQNFSNKYKNKTIPQILKILISDEDFLKNFNCKIIFLSDLIYSEEFAQCFNLLTSFNEKDESIITNLGESLSNNIQSMTQGTTSSQIFKDFFESKKVNTKWFKQLAAKFSKVVYEKTNTFTSSWASLNITYRHKFKAPKALYKNNSISVILSVDHSGSVSTEGLQKLLCVFEEHSKKISKLQVLVHDTEIVKEFTLESDYDIASNPDFKEALSHRFAVGGTSHFKVFERISELINKKQLNPDKTVYISFSDNYSDIPSSWKQFNNFKNLTTIFLSPVDNPVNVKGTLDITMS